MWGLFKFYSFQAKAIKNVRLRRPSELLSGIPGLGEMRSLSRDDLEGMLEDEKYEQETMEIADFMQFVQDFKLKSKSSVIK